MNCVGIFDLLLRLLFKTLQQISNKNTTINNNKKKEREKINLNKC